MHNDIQQLWAIAQKPVRHIIGLMSGTSLDGLDVAWCTIEGAGKQAHVHLKAFHTAPYDADFKAEIRKVFAQKQIDFQHLTFLNVLIAERHAAIVNQCLREWNCAPAQIDLIASHGQTLFHAPRVLHQLDHYPNATLQLGDGDHIARRTGIITISDFRQKHVAAGGEGAPLALYGDYFLFASDTEHRILLNIGGIANFTWLPASGAEAIFATDTGPGNTLIDRFVQQHFNIPFDKDGRIAQAGIPDPGLLEALRSDPFFAAPLPKTIGPELFSTTWVTQALSSLPKGGPAHNPCNLIATLAQLTAETIAAAIQQTAGQKQGALYISGGGAHNPAITEALQRLLPHWNLRPMQALGIPGDAKEAVLFAMLANECVAGNTVPGLELGGVPLVSMGKISLPG